MTTTAPPQTPAAQAAARALVPREEPDLDLATIQSVAGREGVERFETTIAIPVEYQYAIPVRGKKLANGDWDNSASKVGLLSDAYEYMNRVIGATFFMPSEVHDQEGRIQPNPIHRKDYIYLRLGCVYYNPIGQLVLAVEDVEVDFQLVWMDSRANAKSAKVLIDPTTKQPVFDDFGNPALELSQDDELKALRELTRLRGFGPRYAFTVARTRLMKIASGIRSVPNSSTPRVFKVRLVGYRDKMTPYERIESVAGDVKALYGSAPDIEPLTNADMESAGFDAAAEAAVEQGEADHEQPASAEPREPAPRGAAQVAPATCGVVHPEEHGEVCLVAVAPDGGSHLGMHMNAPTIDAATLTWPR